MKAVVLAAGEGIRLKPITSTRPKHMIRICGKPLLEHCLKSLKNSGINEVILIVNYMADVMRDYFADGERLGLKIEYAKQEAILGTGNAVSTAETYIKDDFLLTYGDLLFTAETAKKAIDLHKKSKQAATMVIVPVEDPQHYGIVNLENERRIRSIIEKPHPEKAHTNLANAGIYVFSPEIFGKIKETSASTRGEWEITDAISLLLRDKKQVSALKISAEDWFDIGRPWDLLEANRWVLTKTEHKVLGHVESGSSLVGPISVAETARIRSGVYIEGPAFIDEKTDIGPNCYIRPYTCIGKNVRIGNSCEIKNSLIMNKAHIGHLSYIGDSIIGENCNLGAGTVTANFRLDARTVKMIIKDKIVDSKRRKLGVVLGDGVKTGINALLMPGIKIGSNSWIGPNVVVYRDLGANKILLLKQNTEERNLDSR